MKRKNERGVTLLETLISMTLFVVVLGGVYMMVIAASNRASTEASRVRIKQEARYLLSHFATEFRNAGAGLTATVVLLTNYDEDGIVYPYFTGIQPLNNSKDDGGFADGVIIASADTDAYGVLAQDLDFGAEVPTEIAITGSKDNATGSWVLTYEDDLLAGEDSAWKAEDKGILLGPYGYYIFEVTEVNESVEQLGNTTTELLRLKIDPGDPVYYSGLLDTINYKDDVEQVIPGGSPGNEVMYPGKFTGDTGRYSAVFRLSKFSIYLFRVAMDATRTRKIRQMIRVTNTHGNGDVLRDIDAVDYTIISDHIYDMQISYHIVDNNLEFLETMPDDSYDAIVTDYYGDHNIAHDDLELSTKLRSGRLKNVSMSFIILSGEYRTRTGNYIHEVPAIGDLEPYNLPEGRYTYRMVNAQVHPINYNTSPVFEGENRLQEIGN